MLFRSSPPFGTNHSHAGYLREAPALTQRFGNSFNQLLDSGAHIDLIDHE